MPDDFYADYTRLIAASIDEPLSVECPSCLTVTSNLLEMGNGTAACTLCAHECGRCGFLYTESALLTRQGLLLCYDCVGRDYKTCYLCFYLQERQLPTVGGSGAQVQHHAFVCNTCLTTAFTSHPCYQVPYGTVTRHVRVGAQCALCSLTSGSPSTSLTYVRSCGCGGGTASKPVHQYSCKPKLVFHGKSRQKIHMGFELETRIKNGDDDSEIFDAAQFAMDALQGPEIAELKHDSSIGGGFEIVTQPHSYEKYRDDSRLLWETIETLRTKYGARSWDTRTCGLHIHVSRNAFSGKAHTHNFIEFIYRNPEMLKKFAGRDERNYATFGDCWKRDLYESQFLDIEGKLEKPLNSERGSAVNTLNKGTLELRFFRGTMNPSGVLSALGLTHAMVQYTRGIVVEEDAPREQYFHWLGFQSYVEAHAEEYPELSARMPHIKEFNLKNIPVIQA